MYKQSEPVNYKPVSVIVSSKNQLNDLRSNLIYFLDQDYPQFEVIVINDASSDGTDDYLEELENKNEASPGVHVPHEKNMMI